MDSEEASYVSYEEFCLYKFQAKIWNLQFIYQYINEITVVGFYNQKIITHLKQKSYTGDRLSLVLQSSKYSTELYNVSHFLFTIFF